MLPLSSEWVCCKRMFKIKEACRKKSVDNWTRFIRKLRRWSIVMFFFPEGLHLLAGSYRSYSFNKSLLTFAVYQKLLAASEIRWWTHLTNTNKQKALFQICILIRSCSSLPSVAMISSLTTPQAEGRGGLVYTSGSQSYMEGSQDKSSEQITGGRNGSLRNAASCWVPVSHQFSFSQPWPICVGMLLSTVVHILLYHSTVKTMPHRYSPEPI